MFDELNEATAAQLDEFMIASYDGSTLVLAGGEDLDYYHLVEVSFFGVDFIHCPTLFFSPTFAAGKPTDCAKRFVIRTPEGIFEIRAESVAIVWGRVDHYRDGKPLPGPWIRRTDS